MGLQVYPYIYARTRFNDYCTPALFAPPSNVLNNDQLRKCGRIVTVYSHGNNQRVLRRIRPFMISNVILVGISIDGSAMKKYLQENNSWNDDYAKYMADEAGRPICCSTCIVIPVDQIKDNKIPELSYEWYWENIYMKYVKNVFYQEVDPECTHCDSFTINDTNTNMIDVSNIISKTDGLVIPNDQNLLNKIKPILEKYGCTYKQFGDGSVVLDLRKMTNGESLDVFLTDWLCKFRTIHVRDELINGCNIATIRRIFHDNRYKAFESAIIHTEKQHDPDNPLNKVKRGV